MPSLLEASNVPQEEQQEDICEPSEEADPAKLDRMRNEYPKTPDELPSDPLTCQTMAT